MPFQKSMGSHPHNMATNYPTASPMRQSRKNILEKPLQIFLFSFSTFSEKCGNQNFQIILQTLCIIGTMQSSLLLDYVVRHSTHYHWYWKQTSWQNRFKFSFFFFLGRMRKPEFSNYISKCVPQISKCEPHWYIVVHTVSELYSTPTSTTRKTTTIHHFDSATRSTTSANQTDTHPHPLPLQLSLPPSLITLTESCSIPPTKTLDFNIIYEQ